MKKRPALDVLAFLGYCCVAIVGIVAIAMSLGLI